jgi:predicted outer membrane protein
MKRIAILACGCAFAFGVPYAAAQSQSTARKADKDLSGLDSEYLKTSMQGDLFEIRGGKLAEKKSHNKAVLKLARTLVKDHSQSFSDAAKLARKYGEDVPKSPTPSEVWELSVVSRMSGKTFNRWYSSLEVFDHHQDIQETTDEIKDGSNDEVQEDAKTEIPMLKKHLRLSEAAYRASK